MKKVIVFIVIVTFLGGCSVRVLNFDEKSVIKREYDVFSIEKDNDANQ